MEILGKTLAVFKGSHFCSLVDVGASVLKLAQPGWFNQTDQELDPWPARASYSFWYAPISVVVRRTSGSNRVNRPSEAPSPASELVMCVAFWKYWEWIWNNTMTCSKSIGEGFPNFLEKLDNFLLRVLDAGLRLLYWVMFFVSTHKLARNVKKSI